MRTFEASGACGRQLGFVLDPGLLAGRKPDAHRMYRALRPLDQPKANPLLAEINAAP